MIPENLAAYIDHTLLKPHATREEISDLCNEALEHRFATVCVNPVWVSHVATLLRESGVGIATVVGFPLGASTAFTKVEEARDAIRNGATEIDMVLNIGALKSGYTSFVHDEIESLVSDVEAVPVKVILECCYLTDDEKRIACGLCRDAGAAYVKTSTGFGESGATIDDVRLMKQEVGDVLGIKAAGGIRTLADAMAYIEAGATRIGTSAGVSIVRESISRTPSS